MSKNNDVVIIELDKPRQIKYGIKALKVIEKLLECKITKINFNDIGIDEMLKLLFAGLSWEDKELTLESLEDLVENHSSFSEITSKLTEAITVAFGSKNDQGTVETQK